jgi:hypothetical protein
MNRLYLLASWLTTLRSIRGLSSIVGMHRAWSARDDGRTKSRNWSDRPARRVMLVQFIHPHKRHHPLEYLRDRIHFQPLPNPSPPHHQPPKHRSLYYMCRIQLDLQQSKCRPRKVGGIPLPRLIGLSTAELTPGPASSGILVRDENHASPRNKASHKRLSIGWPRRMPAPKVPPPVFVGEAPTCARLFA